MYFGPWLAGELHDVDAGGIRAVVYRKKEKRTMRKKRPRSASRLRSGSLRSPSLRREAEFLPQSVTHAVSTKCYLCGERVPSLAPPCNEATVFLKPLSPIRNCVFIAPILAETAKSVHGRAEVFLNTKPLQTLVETHVACHCVKYVLLTCRVRPPAARRSAFAAGIAAAPACWRHSNRIPIPLRAGAIRRSPKPGKYMG